MSRSYEDVLRALLRLELSADSRVDVADELQRLTSGEPAEADEERYYRKLLERLTGATAAATPQDEAENESSEAAETDDDTAYWRNRAEVAEQRVAALEAELAALRQSQNDEPPPR